ncbi:MAG: hypothetical protein KAI43_06110 [Candidatus Aureabacteria bacterium]|nr:hypothetical protein [Candidatus Auribacterota bacterium]
MKKRLVFIISLVIIQLFCLNIYGYTYQESIVSLLDVTEVVVENAHAYTPRWILRQVDIEDYSSLKSDDIIREKAYAIEDLYHGRGFYFAICDYTIEELYDGGHRVVYELTEGERVVVEKIDFEGNFFVSAKKFIELIKTRPSGLFVKTFLNEDVIADDKEIIESYYSKKGIKAVVSRVEKVFSEDKRSVNITFFISEKSLTGRFKDKTAKSVLHQVALMQKELEDARISSEKYIADNKDLNRQLTEKEKDIEQLKASSDREINELDNKIIEREEEHKNLQEKVTILEKKLDEKEEIDDMLTGYLAQERMKLKDKEKEIQNLNQEIDDLNLEKAASDKKLAETFEEVEKEKQQNDLLKTKMARFTEMMKHQLNEIDKVNTQLSVVLDQTRHAINKELDAIELSTVIVSGEEEIGLIVQNVNGKKIFIPQDELVDDPKRLTNGRVIKVNKKLNFIIISYGKDHGVKESMDFGIFKDDLMIANIKVIEVRDQISAAEIVYIKEDIEIKEGDLVSQVGS